jgi:putative transposase
MARLRRLALAGHLHHALQRGNNGQPLFADDDDRRAYLDMLQEAVTAHGVAVHGYALLVDQVHLLATPQADDGLSLTMQALGRRYVARYNRRHARRGTLWEGRYRATIVEPAVYFLRNLMHIELQPVHASLAPTPAQWPWSSAAHHVGARRDPLVADHPMYWALGNTPFEREARYRARLDEGISPADALTLTQATLKGWVLGSAQFVATLGEATDRPLQPRRRGRPRKLPQPA